MKLLGGSEPADLGGAGDGVGAHEFDVGGLDGQAAVVGAMLRLAGEFDDLAALGLGPDAHMGVDLLFGHGAGDDVGVVVVLGAQGVQRSVGIVDALPAAVQVGHVDADDVLTGGVPQGVGAGVAAMGAGILGVGGLGGFHDSGQVVAGVGQGGAGDGVHSLVRLGNGFHFGDGLANDEGFDGVIVGGDLNLGARALHVQAVQVAVHALGAQHGDGAGFGVGLAEGAVLDRHAHGGDVFTVAHELEFVDLGQADGLALDDGGDHGEAVTVGVAHDLAQLDGGRFFGGLGKGGGGGQQHHDGHKQGNDLLHKERPPCLMMG